MSLIYWQVGVERFKLWISLLETLQNSLYPKHDSQNNNETKQNKTKQNKKKKFSHPHFESKGHVARECWDIDGSR